MALSNHPAFINILAVMRASVFAMAVAIASSQAHAGLCSAVLGKAKGKDVAENSPTAMDGIGRVGFFDVRDALEIDQSLARVNAALNVIVNKASETLKTYNDFRHELIEGRTLFGKRKITAGDIEKLRSLLRDGHDQLMRIDHHWNEQLRLSARYADYVMNNSEEAKSFVIENLKDIRALDLAAMDPEARLTTVRRLVTDTAFYSGNQGLQSGPRQALMGVMTVNKKYAEFFESSYLPQFKAALTELTAVLIMATDPYLQAEIDKRTKAELYEFALLIEKNDTKIPTSMARRYFELRQALHPDDCYRFLIAEAALAELVRGGQ
jgi:hypothetical protein